jgi:hypothetical protein
MKRPYESTRDSVYSHYRNCSAVNCNVVLGLHSVVSYIRRNVQQQVGCNIINDGGN